MQVLGPPLGTVSLQELEPPCLSPASPVSEKAEGTAPVSVPTTEPRASICLQVSAPLSDPATLLHVTSHFPDLNASPLPHSSAPLGGGGGEKRNWLNQSWRSWGSFWGPGHQLMITLSFEILLCHSTKLTWLNTIIFIDMVTVQPLNFSAQRFCTLHLFNLHLL